MPEAQSISKVAILADPRGPEKEKAISAALDELRGYLNGFGVEIQVFIDGPVRDIKPDPDTQLFVVLGGDGTMIHFAARLSHMNIPFYGLNYGNVGFMMNNPKDGQGLITHAQRIRDGLFTPWDFPILRVRAQNLDGATHEGFGLNDIYLQRMTPQSCKVDINLNGQALKINPLLCDGVIVSTPLGSTAYNYNVTGSMVAINAPVITLTPVAAQRACPVSCMMLTTDTHIRFDILEPEKRRVQVVCDGQSYGDLVHAELSVIDRKVRLCFDPEYSRRLPMRFINKACGE